MYHNLDTYFIKVINYGYPKKYHNVDGNYNHKFLDFDPPKKKKKTIIRMVIITLVTKEVLGWKHLTYRCCDIVPNHFHLRFI